MSRSTKVCDLTALLQGKRLLIFDFDGTLADTSPLHAEAFAGVLAPLGITVDYPALAGLTTRDALSRCLAAAGISVGAMELESMVHSKQQRVRDLIRQRLQPLPGVDQFLRWARLHYRLAVCSSGSRGTVNLSLEKLGYTGWFDPLLCAEDVVRAKPDPEGFLKIMAMASIQADRAVVFEDSAAGLAAAQHAGLAAMDVRVTPFEKLCLILD